MRAVKAEPEAKARKSGEASPAPRRRRRTADAARGEIIAAARELFAEKGYAGTTTRDIAVRARASEVLIFRYFQSKANLFRETMVVPFEQELKDFLAANPPREGAPQFSEARDFVGELYNRLRLHGDSLIALVAARLYESGEALPRSGSGSGTGSGNFQDYFNLAVEVMEDRLGRDGITPAIPLQLSNRIGFAAVVATALFRDWIFADTEIDDSRIIAGLSDFILYAIRTAEPPAD